MKNLKYKELIAYAYSFVSFVLVRLDIEEIILFGSTARGEAGKESDIDLFFNIRNKNQEENIRQILKSELERFYKSKIAEIWHLKGIKNPIKFEVGKLEEWKLKRSIISDGIVLYGRYKNIPEEMKGFVCFNIKPIKNIAKRNKIVRNLFGRKEKVYFRKGIIEEVNGKKLSPLSFILPLSHSQEVINILTKEKIDFSFFEFWTDQI